jgi:hypoxanthine phosphoribosyltransferase
MTEDDPAHCFVLMPSGNREEYSGGEDEAFSVFEEIIKPSVKAGLGEDTIIEREIDNDKPGAITTSIIRNLAESDVVIVDITGHNPNVFLELGIRYALRKNITILLRRKNTTIPFDINVFRCIEYNPWRKTETIGRLSSAIRQAKEASPTRTDSLVYEVYRSLQVNFNEATEGDQPMPWSTYWEKFGRIATILQEASADGRYVPDVVVGMTNGGAVFADLLVRKVGYECPLVALWANRRAADGQYFENAINHSLCDGIVKITRKDKKDIRLLLVDDIIASGTTFTQATRFLRGVFGENSHLRFLPLLYRGDKTSKDIEKLRMIWRHDKFKYDERTINGLHVVNWHRFPYEKDIRST